jgi:hypothetical protein
MGFNSAFKGLKEQQYKKATTKTAKQQEQNKKDKSETV